MTRRPPKRATALAAAKVNVGWRVGAPRADGYHDVCGLILTVSLADRLEVHVGDDDPPGEGGLVCDAGGSALRLLVDDPTLEADDNLVVSAARRLGELTEARPTTVEVGKSIPVGAGLGGGSADAAAALMALNQLWGARLSPRELVELGATVSSDVPALLVGGLVHVSGRGERVRRVGTATAGAFVLGIGTERISSADAYAAADGLPRDPDVAVHHNDLESAARSLVPALGSRIEAMRDACGNAFVSGSGPTVIAAASGDAEARDMAGRVREVFADVLVVEPTDWGVRVVMGGDA